tara:strand:- start:8617 stop:9174 length:558 start_codon:yes stop_codon:yes gene_type:complete
MKRKTFLNALLILFVVSFFVTPLGEFSKVLLYKLFASTPVVIENSKQKKIADYHWKLRDTNHNEFNFKVSKGNVIFVHMWATWLVSSAAELQYVQEIYDIYKGKVDFYIITNEDRNVVQEFMAKKKFTFPVTYLISEENSALDTTIVPATFIIGKQGSIVVHQKKDIAKWKSEVVYAVLDKLIKE